MTPTRVIPIQTGTVSIKTAQATARPGRSALGRKLDMVQDPKWETVPIHAFLIEHDEGRFIVDTGDSARNSIQGYLPWWNPFFRYEVRVNVAPDEELGVHLDKMGIDPAKDVKTVIMSHLHHDHAGGLHHFPHNRILAVREGLEYARSYKGKFMGCLPQRWPPWFKPEVIELRGPPIGPFPTSYPITRDGRIALVPTPGHIVGHASVIVRAEDVTYFIAADASYLEDNIRHERTDGITMDPAVSQRTLHAVKTFATSQPTIVLPSHDPDTASRVANRQLFTGQLQPTSAAS